MKHRFTVIFCLLITAAAHAQFPGWENMSRVVTDTLYSEVLECSRPYNVFLPQNYAADVDRTYPVLYLLHGLWGNNEDWNGRGHVKDVMDQLTASGEAVPMIIVMPAAGGGPQSGEWNGYFNMPGWAYEDYFFKELVPHVENRYRVISAKNGRALAGLSMGGGGTVSYAQRHSDMFCAAYAMSALMDIPQEGAVVSDNPHDRLSLLNQSVKENSCIAFVSEASDETKDALRTIRWYVDCGDDDFLLDRNIEFIREMHQARIPCEFRVRDGGHTWEYWHSALYTCLPFVSRCFAK